LNSKVVRIFPSAGIHENVINNKARKWFKNPKVEEGTAVEPHTGKVESGWWIKTDLVHRISESELAQLRAKSEKEFEHRDPNNSWEGYKAPDPRSYMHGASYQSEGYPGYYNSQIQGRREGISQLTNNIYVRKPDRPITPCAEPPAILSEDNK